MTERSQDSPEHLSYLLTAYLFENLSAAGRREVETHLAHCAQCRAKLEELRGTLGSVTQGFEADETEYVFEERRRKRVLAAAYFHGQHSRRALWWKLAGAAALLLVMACIGIPSLLRTRMGASEQLVMFTEMRPATAPMASPHSAEDQYRWERPSKLEALNSPPREPSSKESSDITVPPDVLAQVELGDHLETINPDRPNTKSAFGDPDAKMFHSERGSDEAAGGGGTSGTNLDDVVGVGGASLPGTGGGWGGGYGTGVGADSGRGSFGNRASGRKLTAKRPAPDAKAPVPPAAPAAKIESNNARDQLLENQKVLAEVKNTALVDTERKGNVEEINKLESAVAKQQQAATIERANEAPARREKMEKEAAQNKAKDQLAPSSSCKAFAEADDIHRRTDYSQDGILEYAQKIGGQKKAEESNPQGDLGLLDKTFPAAEGIPGEAQPKAGYTFTKPTPAPQPASPADAKNIELAIQDVTDLTKAVADFPGPSVEIDTNRIVRGVLSDEDKKIAAKRNKTAENESFQIRRAEQKFQLDGAEWVEQDGKPPFPGLTNGPDKVVADELKPISVLRPRLDPNFPTGRLNAIWGTQAEKASGAAVYANPNKPKMNFSDLDTSGKSAEEARVRESDLFQSRISKLTDMVKQRYEAGDYKGAGRLAERILQLEPSQQSAQEWREKARAAGGSARDSQSGQLLAEDRRGWDDVDEASISQGSLLTAPTQRHYEITESLYRGFQFFRSQNAALSLADFMRRPLSVPAPLLTDEGLDEDAFIEKYGFRPYVDCARDHFSTFAMDVDTASYTLARSRLRENRLPDPETVRTEEFVNYFKQDYLVAGGDAFGVFAEGGPSLFNGAVDALPASKSEAGCVLPRQLEMLKVGIKSREPRPDERKPAALTFVIDSSGSMARGERLALLQHAIETVLSDLRPDDALSIVRFGESAEVLLPRTTGRYVPRIREALKTLTPQGGTNVEAGLALGYRIADESFSPDAINRVILCSDGVANVGAKGPEAILKVVKVFAARGIDLVTVGFGMGDYNDEMMQRLANEGNGACFFVDSRAEAQKIFSEQLPTHLSTLARDAKVQVEFNPQVVERYRLLGYEKRKIADKDFRNDKIDAGEVGHSTLVTALYEIQRRPQSHGSVGKVFLRWKDAAFRHLPVVERNYPLSEGLFAHDAVRVTPELRLLQCVAHFAELLRGNRWVQHSSYQAVLEQLAALPDEFRSREDVRELTELVSAAQRLSLQKWAAELK